MRNAANPPIPFEREHRELLESPPRVQLRVLEDDARHILSRNESPDLPFRWSLNPYRGCFHACAYCYARPTHEFWGLGAGTDFDSHIVVKREAPLLLRRAFSKSSWVGELVVFSGNTDCYQPLEGTCGLTRACLAVCTEFRNPVGIITKAALVVRDTDILQELRDKAWVQVYFSIPFEDDDTARQVEPQAPSITKRLEAMRRLSRAGIPTAVSIAPIIPGLNDRSIPEILLRARDAGATDATYSLLRLSGNVEAVFKERMTQAFPDRIQKIIHRTQEVRGGLLTDGQFFRRQKGTGTYWKMVEQLFEVGRRRAGFRDGEVPSVPHTFSRPEGQQMSLF